MKKFLLTLRVVQQVSNKGREKKLGRGFLDAKRLNPYNPLSYVTLIILLAGGLVCFGIIGLWKQVDISNPFKWN